MVEVNYAIVNKDFDGYYREMGCFLCGCMWRVIEDMITTRPICPECGGCKYQNTHLKDLLLEGQEKFPDAKIGAVTGAILFTEEDCPDDALCTTGALDSTGMFYDQLALESVGIFTPWHEYGQSFCNTCRTEIDVQYHNISECLSNLEKKYIELSMRHKKDIDRLSDNFSKYVAKNNK